MHSTRQYTPCVTATLGHATHCVGGDLLGHLQVIRNDRRIVSNLGGGNVSHMAQMNRTDSVPGPTHWRIG